MENKMKNKELKEKIVEALEPEELQDLRTGLKEKEEELEDLGDWEIYESDADAELDEIYGDVDLAGVSYAFSKILKDTDDSRYEDFKTDIENQKREEQEEELQDEIDDLQEQIDNYN